MITKKIIFLIPFLISITTAYSQSITTIDKIIFLDYRDTIDSKPVHETAKICDSYIQTYYATAKFPYILLDIEQSNDTTYYQLGYDNIFGNSIFFPNQKIWFNSTLGIRIKACGKNINASNILKLLDYGLNHISDLKKIRDNAIKLSYNDKPDHVTIKRKLINRILKQKETDKIKFILDKHPAGADMRR
jgi:hypothetical protein